MFGPSRTLSITPPSDRDVEESLRLAQFVDDFVTPRQGTIEKVLELMNVAARMLLQACTPPPPPVSTLSPSPAPVGRSPTELQPVWVQLRTFGSTGLDSNVHFSDIDTYDGDFQKIVAVSPSYLLPLPAPLLGDGRCTKKKKEFHENSLGTFSPFLS